MESRTICAVGTRFSSIPQFQGQTKEKLTSRDALKLVSGVTRDPTELWLNQHVEAGKKIARSWRIAQAQRAD